MQRSTAGSPQAELLPEEGRREFANWGRKPPVSAPGAAVSASQSAASAAKLGGGQRRVERLAERDRQRSFHLRKPSQVYCKNACLYAIYNDWVVMGLMDTATAAAFANTKVQFGINGCC